MKPKHHSQAHSVTCECVAQQMQSKRMQHDKYCLKFENEIPILIRLFCAFLAKLTLDVQNRDKPLQMNRYESSNNVGYTAK